MLYAPCRWMKLMINKRIYGLSDFDFDLPEDLIAQFPVEKRDESRLMAVRRKTGEISHSRFYRLCDYLSGDDVLVFNNAKVIPARLQFSRESGGRVEIILTGKASENRWMVLSNRTARLKSGETLVSAVDPSITMRVLRRVDEYLEVETSRPFDDETLHNIGSIPLPPYIRREAAPSDDEQYQTVYAKESGAVAAPTAGLHFTRELMNAIVEKGITTVYLTLYVSWGTFQPVRHEDISLHKMHSEKFDFDKADAAAVTAARRDGRRIIAVGTTSLRVLESVYTDGVYSGGRGETDIFIYPPREVRSIDALVTNFHMPRSTLLMLVAAFAGYDCIMRAYREAVRNRYRFFSYGDAMLIF